IRSNTQFGKVVSSHSSACGASSFVAKLRIDSRSASCSSVKMKWRFCDPKSGFRTFSAVAMWRGSPRWTDGSRDGSRPGGESKQWYCLLSAGKGLASPRHVPGGSWWGQGRRAGAARAEPNGRLVPLGPGEEALASAEV